MASTMAGVHICRLCVNVCNDHKSLYDDKEVYEITVKYFDPMFLNLRNFTALCFDCWCHIVDFYNFQQSVQLAQAKLGDSPEMHNISASKESNNPNVTNETLSQQSIIIKEEPQYIDSGPENPDDELILPELLFDVHELDIMPKKYPVSAKPVVSSKSHNSFELHKPIGIATPMAMVTIPLDVAKPIAKENISPLKVSPETLKRTMSNQSDQHLINLKKSLVAKILTKNNNNSLANNSTAIGETSSKPTSSKVLHTKHDILTDQEKPPPPTTKTSPKRLSSGGDKKKKSVMELDASIAKLKPALECELCSKNFPSFTLLQNHFLVDHPGGEFHVSCCQRKFIHRSRLEEHLRIHKDTLLPPSPQCPACGKKFELQKTLINHTRQCPRYKMKFGLKGRSNNKRKRVQVKKKTTVTTTNINNNSTKQVQIKNVPIPLAESKQNQIRNSTETIECKQCGVCLENVAQLRIHNTKYHAVRNFKCSYCVKAFTRSDSLREHMATHTGTPLYSCPYCPRTFIYSSTKRKHLKDEHPNMQPTQDNIIVVPHKQRISNIKTTNKQKSRR